MNRQDNAMRSIAAIEATAGKSAARSARRRALRSGQIPASRSFGADRRPGWLTYTILSVVLLISFYPLWYSVLLASSDMPTISRTRIPSLIPEGKLWENFNRVLEADIDLGLAIWNSVVVAVLTVLSVVLFSTLAGFAFSKLRFRGNNTLLVFIVATMAVPAQLSIVPLFIIMMQLQWTGTLAAVIVPGMVSAFGVFWMTQYLRGALPYELVEAARVDGCSMIQIFWHVVLPAARPAAATLGLFTFVGSWTSYFWPFIILGSENPTLPVALGMLRGTYSSDYSLIMAGVLIATVPLVLLYIFTGRQLVSGVMQGAVKG